MNVASILKVKGGEVATIDASMSVAQAAKTLTDKGIGAVIVTSADKPVAGILSERDIVRGAARAGSSVLDAAASSLMTAEVMCCAPDDSIDSLMAMMTDRRIRHVPVMDDGKLVGIVSIGDVVKFRIEETEREAEALKEYIATG